MMYELECFVVCLPPGTGDAQLTMLQQILVTGAVVVTALQNVALDNAGKVSGFSTSRRQLYSASSRI
jgi:Mrp family chromosome partitioning ATPase